jgi:hypothetical protein
MKKYLIIVLSIILVISVYLGYMSFRNKIVILDDVVLKDNSDNLLAIYVETSAESGVYEVYNNSTFPTTGYVFNTNKSGCVDANDIIIPNALSYSNNKVIVSTRKTSKCYVYYDVFVPGFASIGTDSITGLPIVRSTSIPSEEFYDITNAIDYSTLISTNGNMYNYASDKSILFAKYSLYVGQICLSDDTCTPISTSATGYGLQSADAKGWINGESQWVAVVPFSGSRYWYDSSTSTIKPQYGTYTNFANNVYDTTYVTAPNYSVAFRSNTENANYSIAYYVEEYINTLGVNGIGRLLTYAESIAMTHDQITNGANYWLGSAYNDLGLRNVNAGGAMGGSTYNVVNSSSVRPVIVVNTSRIS